jgi:hypothetical protein
MAISAVEFQVLQGLTFIQIIPEPIDQPSENVQIPFETSNAYLHRQLVLRVSSVAWLKLVSTCNGGGHACQGNYAASKRSPSAEPL